MPGQVGREILMRAELPPRHGIPTGRDPLAEVWDRAGPERDVDERVTLEDPLALCFRVAATDGDDEIGTLTLACAGVSEVCGEPGIRLLADGARVEDDDVGRFR